MRLTDFCFPNHSTPSTRVSSTSAVVARFSPDAPTEDRAFHDGAIRFGGPFSFLFLRGAGERSLLPWRPKDRASDTLVASPAGARGAFARTSRSGAAEIASPAPP